MANNIYDFTPIDPNGVGQGFNQQAQGQQTAVATFESGINDILKIPKDIREKELKDFETVGKKNVDSVVNDINAISDIDTFLAQEESGKLAFNADTLTERGYNTERGLGSTNPFGETSTEAGIKRAQDAVEAKRASLLDKETKMFTRQDTLNNRATKSAESDFDQAITNSGVRDDYDKSTAYLEDPEGFLKDYPQYKSVPGILNSLKTYTMQTDPETGFIGSKQRNDTVAQIDLNNETIAVETQKLANSPLLTDLPMNEITDSSGNISSDFYTRNYQEQGELQELIANMVKNKEIEVENSILNDLSPGSDGYNEALISVSSKVTQGLLELANTPETLDFNPANYAKTEEKRLAAKLQAPGSTFSKSQEPALYEYLQSTEGVKPVDGKFRANDPDVDRGIQKYLASLATQDGLLDNQGRLKLTAANIRSMFAFPDTLVNEAAFPKLWGEGGEFDHQGFTSRVIKNKQNLNRSIAVNHNRGINTQSFLLQQARATERIAGINQNSQSLQNKLAAGSNTNKK